jgi:hypothetical protein
MIPNIAEKLMTTINYETELTLDLERLGSTGKYK